MDALTLQQVRIGKGRMVIIVDIADGFPKMTDSTIASRAIEFHPTIGQHTCINDRGPTFASVMSHTSLPHLLEHLVIAEQLDAVIDDDATQTMTPDRSLVGTTEWIDESTARIEVSFFDDLVAARSLTRALELLNSLL